MKKPGSVMWAAAGVLAYWFDQVGAKGWFTPSAAVDEETLRRFGTLYEQLVADAAWRRDWLVSPDASLALILVLDQFPRNMFRGRAQSFAADALALAAARSAIDLGHDMATAVERRIFYYLPFEHSENLADQDECVRLVAMRADVGEALKYAELHRDIIRRFGRFPHRNKILGRPSTPEEEQYMHDEGHSFGAVAT